VSDGVPTIPLDKSAIEYAPTFGRFEARGMLGRGGMGLVIRAYDPKLGRDVALKLIAPERWEAATIGKQRLELEARALAQLSHPNVVTVYDIGTLGEQPFIAMELVDGVTLRTWTTSERRDERAVIAMFAASARGLAAAHAAGFVHRDFKPDNVLIGSDGRPRVTDFGLVASKTACLKNIEGTPAYMAPEQWLGEPVDARADQFAFCVALWEALAGGRPFAADDAPDSQLREAVLAGTLRDEPRPRRAIAAILARGLARRPEDRWPSLEALIAALEPRPRRYWIAAGLAGIAAAGIAVWLMSSREADQTCTLRGQRIDEAWNAPARSRLIATFQTASPQTGSLVASYVTDTLDRYATTWAAAERAVCAAEPSPIVARRTECLEEARQSFARLVTVLSTANAKAVDRSSAAVDNLLEIAACEDTVALAATAPPPSDPTVRTRMTEILRDLDKGFELELRGEHAKALAITRPIVARARELGHAKSLALALEQQGDLERDAGNLVAAEASYRAGAEAAADARHDRLAAKMWSNLLFVGAEQGGDLTRFAALVPVADAAVRRAGNPPHLRFLYLMGSGVLAAWSQDLATARTRFAAAADLMKHSPRRRGEALVNLTIATSETAGAHVALPLAKEAAELNEQANGPHHIGTAVALIAYAQLALRVGHLDDAERAATRALAIIERSIGRRTGLAAGAIRTLGVAAGQRNDLARARTLLGEAIAIQTALAPSDYDHGLHLAALAATLVDAGLVAEALPHYERAITHFDKAIPNSPEGHAFAVQYAGALAQADRCTDALPILDRAELLLSKVPHLYVELLVTRGVCGDLPSLESAVTFCDERPCELLTAARARYELAKRLSDRARASTLAAKAHDALFAAGVRTPIVNALAKI
jgi:tetratricopeptide (TPR) repeat protein